MFAIKACFQSGFRTLHLSLDKNNRANGRPRRKAKYASFLHLYLRVECESDEFIGLVKVSLNKEDEERMKFCISLEQKTS
jgi:hypothetical protein